MTTTVGLVCKDGVLLASDHRATMGSFIADKNAVKVLKIADHIGITIAGAVSHAQAIARTLKAQANLYRHTHGGKQISVKALSTMLSNMLCSQPLSLQLLMGGVDKNGGSLYNLGGDGSCIEQDGFSVTGSGSPVAIGVFEAMCSPEDMSMEEATQIVIKAVKAAMERDSASGNGIRLIRITKDGYEEIEDAEHLLEE